MAPSKHFTFNDDKAYRIVGGKYKVVGEDEDDYKLQNIKTKEIVFVGKHYAKTNNISEIKVVAPSPFRFEVEDKNWGRLYFNNQLLDGSSMIASDKKYIEFIVPKETYEEIKDQLPKHDILISNVFYNDVIISDISKINIIDNKGLLKEIKVSTPGLIGTLQTYRSQIDFTDNLKEAAELSLQGAKLVLPIFEKLVPDDKVPRKAIESAQAYLLNPTAENKRAITQVSSDTSGYPDAAKLVRNAIYMTVWAVANNELLGDFQTDNKYAKSSIVYALAAVQKDQDSQLEEIKVLPPNSFRLEVERKIDPDRVNDAGDYFEGSSYFNDILLDEHSTLKDKEFIILDITSKIYETIKDKLPSHIILFPFDSGETRIKIDYTKDLNIVYKQGLNEIKVNPPPVLRFEINERRATVRDEFFGNLYLHGELLDDMAFLSLSKALVTSMPKEVYDRVKDQFPPYEVLDVSGYDGLVEILFDDTKEIQIIDKRGLNEIKVLSPSPFRVEVYLHDDEDEEDYTAESYFNDTLLDDDTIVNTTDGTIIVDIPSEIYNTIKNQLPPHKVIPHRVRFARIKIEGLKNINIVYKEGQLQEIKVNPPSPFRFEITRKGDQLQEGEFYFNDILLDDDALFSEVNGYIAVHIPSKIYNNIENILPPHDVMSIYRGSRSYSGKTHVITINDISNVRIVNNLSEIKVNTPGLLGTLEHYASQINSSNNVEFKQQLALKCAELVLPIYEKKFPNDSRPRKAIEAVKVYLLDPTDENDAIVVTNSDEADNAKREADERGTRLHSSYEAAAHAATSVKYAIDNIIYDVSYVDCAKIAGNTAVKAAKLDTGIPIDEIKINKPNSTLRFEIDRNGNIDSAHIGGSLYLGNKLLDSRVIWYEYRNVMHITLPLETYYSIKDQLPSYEEVREYTSSSHNGMRVIDLYINDLSNIEIVGIQSSLDEIKINAPKPFVFEIDKYDEADRSYEGKLFLNGQLLSDKAIYDSTYNDGVRGRYIAFYLATKKYKELFSQLSPYNSFTTKGRDTPEYLDTFSDGYRHFIAIKKMDAVKIVDEKDLMTEIKVVPPVGPGKLKVEGPYMHWGDFAGYIRSQHNPGLPIKDKFVDILTDYIRIYFSETDNADFESNFKMLESYLNRRNIKFTFKNATNDANGEEYYLVKIPKSQIEFVNRQGLMTEIKIVAPGIVSTLENYHSKIRATQDDNTKKELVLRCAELVLPIFEKHYPNDDRPRKAIEAAKAYLLDPTEENKETLRVAKSGASSANVAAYHNSYDDNHAAVVASAAICLSADTIYNYLQVAESAANSAIRAAKLDQNIQEIKVNKPGILSTLENYKSQIESSQDVNIKRQLAIKCAELVLPIFEKYIPDDNRPRKTLEAAKKYLVDPTTANGTSVMNKSYDLYKAINKFRNRIATVAALAVKEASTNTYANNMGAIVTANYAIEAAKLDQNLQEIKVVPPQRRIDPDEYEVIYQLLQGDRKPTYLDDEIWGIDFDSISREYFTNPNPIFMEPERYEEMAEYLDKNNMLLAFRALPIIELDNPNVHNRDNEAKYPKQQYYILKHDNKFYFVDSQGANYPRYISYLKNFPL